MNNNVYSFLAKTARSTISSTDVQVVLAIVLMFVAVYHIRNWLTPSRAPPKPWGLPVVGNLLQFGALPHLDLTRIGKDFGDVFSLRLGSWDVLVLNSHESAKEALLKKASHFSSRPPFNSLRLSESDKYSVTFGDYSPSQIQRKKALLQIFHQAILTNQNHLNYIFSREISGMKRQLLETGSDPFDPRACLKMAVGRIVFRMTFGYSMDDEEEKNLSRLFQNAQDFREKVSGKAILADFMPWLRFALKQPIVELENSVKTLITFVGKAYCQRKGEYKLDNEEFCVAKAVTNYVTTLKQSEKTGIESGLTMGEKQEGEVDKEAAQNTAEPGKKSTKKEDEETEKQIITMLAPDVFGAALENISSLFCWAVAFVASHEELQKDLHAELDQVVGKDREPVVQDKKRMPIMQATIMETLRHSSLIPLGIPHYCIEDSVVKGYEVAKGTLVLTNIWGINHDERRFSHPYSFEPYRFLDLNGELRGDRCSLMMAFNTGPRACAGIAVTKTVLFYLLSNLMSNFDLHSSEDWTSLGPLPGPQLAPDSFKVQFSPRR